MTFWQRMGRWLDNLLGGPDHSTDVDPTRIDAAIKLIQTTIDEQQREQQVRRLNVSDLDESRQNRLANELRELLAKRDAE